MKPIRFSKKLIFNKKTIVNLNDVTMKRVWAGGPTVPDTEVSYCTCFGFTCTGSFNPEECCATIPIP
jgi:hypothetical protein